MSARETKKKVYLISGLGADERAFQFLNLGFCEPVFLKWLPPLQRETLANYATRMAAGIEPDAMVIGLSMGGMIATEIAKQRPDVKAILISSSKTRFEIPWFLKMWRHVPVYRFQLRRMKKLFPGLIAFTNGPKGKRQQQVFKDMFNESDLAFSKWAMDAILSWDNVTVPENLVHIHGTADKVLPYRFVKPHYTIQNGEHVMLMNQPEEISKLLREIIIGQ